MSEINSPDLSALHDLRKELSDLSQVVDRLIKSNDEGLFRFLSKKTRNDLLNSLIEQSGEIQDAAKAAFRAIKKVKRVKLPDSVADLLLVNDHDGAVNVSSTMLYTQPVINDTDTDNDEESQDQE